MGKTEIRNKIKSIRDIQTQEEINKKSEVIINKLIATHEYKKSKFIFVYVSFGSEVETHELIKTSLKEGKMIGVPLSDIASKEMICSEIKDFDKELEKKTFYILEPKKEYVRKVGIEKIDLVIVPCVAFDKRCFRVGYGGGFYDRFLKVLNKDVPTICFAYELQMVADIPISYHDVAVKKIITELNEYQKES